MEDHKLIRVVVGAGANAHNNPGWIHTQQDDLDLLNRQQWVDRFQSNSIHTILAEHVWEHLTFEQGVEAAKVCFEFLQPGGFIRCAVPDGYFPDEEYQRIVQVGGPGPKDHPAASHRIVFTYHTLVQLFENAGYEVKLLEYFDETGEFHYQDWNESEGFIYRTLRFDHRNQNGKIGCTSILVDAIKPFNNSKQVDLSLERIL